MTLENDLPEVPRAARGTSLLMRERPVEIDFDDVANDDGLQEIRSMPEMGVSRFRRMTPLSPVKGSQDTGTTSSDSMYEVLESAVRRATAAAVTTSSAAARPPRAITSPTNCGCGSGGDVFGFLCDALAASSAPQFSASSAATGRSRPSALGAPPLKLSQSQPKQLMGAEDGEVVWLHIYDIFAGPFEWVNHLTRPAGTGFFHAAIEVYSQEWSYGHNRAGSGVYNVKPRCDPQHVYRESIKLGYTSKSKQEVISIVGKMKMEWRGQEYDLLYNNCCHFCDNLGTHLGVGPAPEWVANLAASGAKIVDQIMIAPKAVGNVAAAIDDRYNISSLTPTEIEFDGVESAAVELWNSAIAHLQKVAHVPQSLVIMYPQGPPRLKSVDAVPSEFLRAVAHV
eukprot:TRINITY_DN87315_c0_g1_i1.p1 TRINITY_DN87315_c0_g1~~TRINITY_DN87315_c0_g1_i1.p1  ORF type:complete len:405 (-),score=60.48 TRINITY_DN87315_c0_g1_i1:51-1238(-)